MPLLCLMPGVVNAGPCIFCPWHFREFFRAFATIPDSKTPLNITVTSGLTNRSTVYRPLSSPLFRASRELTKSQQLCATLYRIETAVRSSPKSRPDFANRSATCRTGALYPPREIPAVPASPHHRRCARRRNDGNAAGTHAAGLTRSPRRRPVPSCSGSSSRCPSRWN